MTKSISLPIYLSIIFSTIIFLFIVLFFAYKFLKSEKGVSMAIYISSALLFAIVLSNRIMKTYYYVNVSHFEGYTWWYVLPDTICTFCAFALPITLFVKPKDSIILHSIIHIAFAAGVLGIFFITYFDEHSLSDPLWLGTCIVSFFMHIFLVGIILFLIISKRFKPQMKAWYYTIIAYGIMMLLGVFEVYVLQFPKTDHVMNLFTPLLASQPILTSWYIVWVGYAVGTPIFLFLYEHFVYHRKCIDILKEMNPFKK